MFSNKEDRITQKCHKNVEHLIDFKIQFYMAEIHHHIDAYNIFLLNLLVTISSNA